MTLAGHDATIYVSQPRDSTSMTDEAMSDTGNGTLFTIDDFAKVIFDPSVTFTVKSNGSAVSASNYTIRYATGAVEFDSTQSGNTITISGNYFGKTELLEASEMTLSLSNNLDEITNFGDNGVRRHGTVQDVSGSFQQYEILQNALDTGEPDLEDLVLKTGNATSGKIVHFLYDMRTASGREIVGAWVQLSEDAFEAASDGTQTKELSFEGCKIDSTMTTQNAKVLDIIRQ